MAGRSKGLTGRRQRSRSAADPPTGAAACKFCGIGTAESLLRRDPRTNERYCPSCTALIARLEMTND